MNYVRHAEERLAQRGITKQDVDAALLHPYGDPVPGSGLGNMVYTGLSLQGGRLLKVVQPALDDELVITAYWDEGGS
jgi:hypothetical protein